MGKLKYLVIHCTATPENRIVTKEDIVKWHTSPVSKGGRGWKKVGYSDLIALDGTVINMVSYNKDSVVDTFEITNGVAGFNSVCRHIVYAGGIDKYTFKPKDTRTWNQKVALEEYVKNFIKDHPDILVCGHYFLDNKKACPSFNVEIWLKGIGVLDKNIAK